MLKPAWYLVSGDFLAEPFLTADHPKAHQLATAYASAVVLLSDEGLFDREHTELAVRLGLLSATRLLDTATNGIGISDKDELARVVNGMALLHAYLAQTLQRFADLARIAAAAGTSPAGFTREVADALTSAGDGGEFVAGDLKRAYLALVSPAE
ncbi:hypothetical protein SAMN05421812_102638 [Asanoa hainanensis]|uniref:Uncharacterized protein n=1 Tax=Asanoa hainanensis TaxID=560556 RepID=A0A239IYX3_9ACTN|nr:hypothetical protein [Asanoa hainanensis]SNS98735.1 hypothetical protein SAMN05421812_102638 [Asanoa hainanensis]